MKKFLSTVAVLLLLGGIGQGAVVTDTPSSKNELLMRGASPHLRFVDDDGNDYTLTVNGDVMRVENLDANPFFNLPPDGSIGIELNAPTSVMVTPFTTGGSLADGDYFFVVTALDGFGETIASSEVQCTVSGGGGSGRCDLSWAAVSPPAQTYNVYIGTGAGLESSFDDGIVGTTYSATASPLPNSGSPPDATTAYFIRMAPDGIHFSDGSIQSSAGGSAAWQISGSNILSAQTGNVGIGTGAVFTPDAKLTVLGAIDVNDRGTIRGAATNSVQVYSNWRSSTNTLWNAAQSSWAINLGDGADAFRVYRAPATGGTPVYVPLIDIDGTTRNFNINTKAAFQTRFNIDSNGVLTLTGNSAANIFTAGVGSQPFLRLDTLTETFEFIIVNTNQYNINFSGTSLVFTDFTNTLFQVQSTAAADSTNIVVLRNGSLTPVSVTLGPNDGTCGGGFRCLRVPN